MAWYHSYIVSGGFLAASLALHPTAVVNTFHTLVISPLERLVEGVDDSPIVREFSTGNAKHTVVIDREDYDASKQLDRVPDNASYLNKAITPQHSEMEEILDKNLDISRYNNEEKAQRILDFVNGIEYKSDTIHTMKRPIETIVEGGDCEDLSVLTYSLMERAGVDAIIIRIPPSQSESSGHMLVGVAGDFTGYHVKYNDKEYFFAESTMSGDSRWRIGNINPDWISLKNIEIYKP